MENHIDGIFHPHFGLLQDQLDISPTQTAKHGREEQQNESEEVELREFISK